jgi:hypothetical protein
MVKPSEMVSRLDLVVLELAAARIVFWGYAWGFLDFREFIGWRGGATEAQGGQHPPSRAWPWWHGLVGVPHLGLHLRYFFLSTVVFWPKKFHKKFRCVWTPFDMDFL